jgi:hypothetical protein
VTEGRTVAKLSKGERGELADGLRERSILFARPRAIDAEAFGKFVNSNGECHVFNSEIY